MDTLNDLKARGILLDFLGEGCFPPASDRERIAGYKERELLYESKHKEAFADRSAKLPPGVAEKVYLALDYPAMISRVCADMLVGKPPVISPPENATQEQEQSLKDLLGSEEEGTDTLPVLLYEGELSASSRGDAVFVVEVLVNRIQFREIPASNVFVVRNPDNVRQALSHAVAWPREYINAEGKTAHALRVNHYTPDGKIWREAFEYDPPSGKVDFALRLQDVYGPQASASLLEEMHDTGIGISPLVHVPNERYGKDYWGRSDYSEGLISLFDEINNRWTKISEVLDKHADPKVVLPEQFISVQPDGNLRARDMEAMWVDAKVAGNLPRYLTWEGQLIAAFKELDGLVDQVMKFSEVSPAIFGEDKAGSVESARAMKFRFIRTVAKVARKKMYRDPALRRLLWIAQKLKQRWLDGPEPVRPTIVWQDGVPQDYREAVEVEVQRYDGGLTSREDAIRKIDLVSAAEAKAFARRIDDEEAERAKTAPAPAAAGGPPAPGSAQE